MTKNYSGNTKIREKSSMYMRNKFCSINFSIWELLRTKTVLLVKLQLQRNSEKPFQLTKLLYGLLTSPVWPADVTCTVCTHGTNSTSYTCTWIYCCDSHVQLFLHVVRSTRVVRTVWITHAAFLPLLLTHAASSPWMKNRESQSRIPKPNLSKWRISLLKFVSQSSWKECSLTHANTIMTRWKCHNEMCSASSHCLSFYRSLMSEIRNPF
jgi:hypothetical protein